MLPLKQASLGLPWFLPLAWPVWDMGGPWESQQDGQLVEGTNARAQFTVTIGSANPESEHGNMVSNLVPGKNRHMSLSG